MVSGVGLVLDVDPSHVFISNNCRDSQKRTIEDFIKALGYSNGQLAKRFWAFESVLELEHFWLFRFFFSWMGHFYDFRNEKGILPDITIHFHWQLLVALVILPTTFFMVLAIGYARRQLQTPALRLLKKSPTPIKVKRRKGPRKEILPKRATLSRLWRKSILFLWSLAPCASRPWSNCPLA